MSKVLKINIPEHKCINCDEWTTDWRTYGEGSYMCLLCTKARGEGEWA